MKIILDGSGGQGIKFLGHVLAGVLAYFGKEVSLTYQYDAAVQQGDITAFLIYSNSKIENPIIDKADILLKLNNKKSKFSADKIIVERGFCKDNCEICGKECKNIEKISFKKIANEKFGTFKVVNMIGLGKLMHMIGFDLNEEVLRKKLPEEFIEKNIEAIKYGFSYREALE